MQVFTAAGDQCRLLQSFLQLKVILKSTSAADVWGTAVFLPGWVLGGGGDVRIVRFQKGNGGHADNATCSLVS
jgi:hypothetical protein